MINSVYARVLHLELRHRGLIDQDLFAGTALTETAIWSSERVDNRDFLQLLNNARQRFPDESLGFLIGSRQNMATTNMMGIAMYSAPTLRDGLQAMASYSSLAADYVRSELFAGPHTATIKLHFDNLADCHDIHVESVFIMIQHYIESVTGRPSSQAEFLVSYPPPPLVACYRQFLHGAITFNQAFDAIKFPASWLTLRSPFSDTDLWTMSRQQLALGLQAKSGADTAPFTSHLRSYMRAYEPPLPNIQATAGSLHLSTRTLNRRLQEEGSTFRQIRLEVTHKWAMRLLLDDTNVEAVALTLGYGDASNFRRSFREHTGMSPSRWLASQRTALNPVAP